MTLALRLTQTEFGHYWVTAGGDLMLCAFWLKQNTDISNDVRELELVLTNENPRDPQRCVKISKIFRDIDGQPYVTIDRRKRPVEITEALADQVDRIGHEVWAWLEVQA